MMTLRMPTVVNSRVKALIENEWEQLMGNKVVIFTTIGPPIFLVVLALSALYMSNWLNADITTINQSRLSDEQYKALMDALKEAQSLQRDLRFALLSSFLVLFQIIPMVVPLSIASHSIVGEKVNRSLEPLLAAPVRTSELLLAKALASALPGILVTWYGYALFAIGARFAVSDSIYNRLVIGPTWLLSIVLMTPLFTMLTVGLSIIISSRVRDPNTAQQLGTVVILPLLGVMIVQMIGVTAASPTIVLITAVVIAIVNIWIMRVAVRLFRREEILTTWR